ncbi:hypothetical protein ZWY2020_033513 [Hordeum vulgare]|nr:hypothetical protein ZWY2020_033513 [Hordeum vulgare]
MRKRLSGAASQRCSPLHRTERLQTASSGPRNWEWLCLCFYESLTPHLGGAMGASSSLHPGGSEVSTLDPAVSVAPWPPALQAPPPRAASNGVIGMSSTETKSRPSV